jgi:hypothetical protein
LGLHKPSLLAVVRIRHASSLALIPSVRLCDGINPVRTSTSEWMHCTIVGVSVIGLCIEPLDWIALDSPSRGKGETAE